MIPTVLVTGGTGYIALEIIFQLLSEGKCKVRATVRSLDNKHRNQPLLDLVPDAKHGPPELVAADLLSDSGWAEAIKGVDYVMHTASPFFVSNKEDDLVKPAVEGTLNVLRACSAEGSKVKRVVLTSSVAAVAYGQPDKPGSHVFTEADWSIAENCDPYTKSKTMAEKAAWDFVEKNTGHKFELTTINPSLVLGHCRTTPGTSVDIVRQVMTGQIPMIPYMIFGIVAVEDVAAAHVTAITCSKAPGERFILSNSEMTLTEVADVLAEQFPEVKVCTTRMPLWFARMLSPVMPMMRGLVKDWGKELHVDGSKAANVLGFQYRDLKVSIKETGDSLIEAGLVAPKTGKGTTGGLVVGAATAIAAVGVAVFAMRNR